MTELCCVGELREPGRHLGVGVELGQVGLADGEVLGRRLLAPLPIARARTRLCVCATGKLENVCGRRLPSGRRMGGGPARSLEHAIVCLLRECVCACLGQLEARLEDHGVEGVARRLLPLGRQRRLHPHRCAHSSSPAADSGGARGADRRCRPPVARRAQRAVRQGHPQAACGALSAGSRRISFPHLR